MTTDPVEQLAGLLREAKAVPRIVTSRIARSAFYDAAYRACVVALTMRQCAKEVGGVLEMNDQKLRLFQFVAVHRALLGPLRTWVAARRSGRAMSILEWSGLPSGYSTDTTYGALLRYLTATGELCHVSTKVSWARDPDAYLTQLVALADDNTLFTPEREVLSELAAVKLTTGMLQE